MVETRDKEEGIADFSLKTFLVTIIGILLFGIYVGVLMYGENSLTVLNQLKEKKQSTTFVHLLNNDLCNSRS